MNRLLITFLALLTGLVAQVSPVAAAVRAGGDTEIGALANDQAQRRGAATVVVDVARHAQADPARITFAPKPQVTSAVLARTVMTGIDRARE